MSDEPVARPAPSAAAPDEVRLTAKHLVKRIMRLPLAYRFRLLGRLLRSRAVPKRARLPLGGLVLYLAMPIDVIPDFIPVIGQLDDLLVAVIAVWWFLRVCPAAVVLAEVERLEQRPQSRVDRALPWLLIGLGCLLAGLTVFWLLRR